MRVASAVACALLLGWQGARAQSAGEQVIAALERYRLAVLELDIEREVSSFTEDAELSQGNEPVLQGRTTIRALLNAQGIKVVAYDLHAAATRVEGRVAIQNGLFSQRIILPQHEARLIKGVFEVQWLHQQDGSWLINRLHTEPSE